jgi:hypothetical protein
VIEAAQKDRELLAFIDPITLLPVAFQFGGLLRIGILGVRAEFRGEG